MYLVFIFRYILSNKIILYLVINYYYYHTIHSYVKKNITHNNKVGLFPISKALLYDLQ